LLAVAADSLATVDKSMLFIALMIAVLLAVA
jgi:hypothetical protein